MLPQDKECNLCPELVASRKQIVYGELIGAEFPRIVLIGEAPGFEEDREGRPFIGVSGDELRRALAVNGLLQYGVYVTNVCLCHPPKNRDPLTSEITCCVASHLTPKLEELQPRWVITVGRIASQVIAGPEFSIELEHGIPRHLSAAFRDLEFIHIPTYHPAAGLHEPSKMILFMGDMRTAGQVVKGKLSPNPPVDTLARKEHYKELWDGMEVTCS